MNNQEDEYIVEIWNGDKHYYKNGLLHCESGPAVVHERFYHPIADNLYASNEVRTGQGKYETYYTSLQGHKVFEHVYYLEGIGYQEAEYNVIMLRKELEKDLDPNQRNNKKSKI